jgi:hypothetical protein
VSAGSRKIFWGFFGAILAAMIAATATLVAPMLNHSPAPPASAPNIVISNVVSNNNNLGTGAGVSPPVSGSASTTQQPLGEIAAVPYKSPPLPRPAPLPAFGLHVECLSIDPRKDTRGILATVGSRALTEAQSAWTARNVIVSSMVGGGNLGTLSANTPVRVICREESDFALIKQEQDRGYPDGVVEIGALDVRPVQ